MAKKTIFFMFLISASNIANAESYGSSRDMIDLSTQPTQQISAEPNSQRTIKVSPSGLNDRNFMVWPSISLSDTAKNQLKDIIASCKSDPSKEYDKFISMHVFPKYNKEHVEKQLSQTFKNSSITKNTVTNISLYGFKFSIPNQNDVFYPNNLFSNPDIATSPYSSNSIVDIPISGDCDYFREIYKFNRINGMMVQGLVGYTSYKRAMSAVSFSAFLLSDQTQRIFSKAKNEGKLTFEQKTKGSASGLLTGLFKSKSSAKIVGGLVDTRARWVTADVIRRASAAYYASITSTTISDGLSVAPLQSRINKFIDYFMHQVSTQTATIPLIESEFTKMEQDIDFLPSNLEESRKQIIKAVASAKANHSMGLKTDGCMKKVMSSFSPKASAMNKTSEQANKTTKISKGVKEAPKDQDTCKVDSSTSAAGGVTFKFEGQQNTWIPLSLDVHKVEKKNWEAQVELSMQNIELSKNETRKWITITNDKINELTLLDQVGKLKKELQDIKNSSSIEHGVKMCIFARTGEWHNTIAVPKQWTKEMCASFFSQFQAGNGADTYYLGCMFRDYFTASSANSGTPPVRNCGW